MCFFFLKQAGMLGQHGGFGEERSLDGLLQQPAQLQAARGSESLALYLL